MASVITLGISGTVLAIKFELGANVSGFLLMAPIISIPLAYVWFARRIAKSTEHKTVTVGTDGLLAEGRFISWAEVQTIEQLQTGPESQLVLRRVGTSALVIRDPPPELVAQARTYHARHSTLEAPPVLDGRELETGTDHYRTASRPLLVRIASNPEVAAKLRVRAAERLYMEGAFHEDIWDALEESADPAIRAFLDAHDPGP